MWTGLSISSVSMSGSNMTCTYSGLTGLALAVGRTLTITGWTGGNTGNNGTFRITSLGAGTFTCVNSSGVNVASGGTGVVTQSSSAPAGNVYNYEIWQPGDGNQNFYLKLEYGNNNTNGSMAWPTIRISLGTATNGSGTLTGFVTAAIPISTNAQGIFTPSTTQSFECDFSGDSGRLSIILFRNSFYQCQGFCVQRALNSSGATTNEYVSMFGFGSTRFFVSFNQAYPSSTFQSTLHFTYGVLGYFPRSVEVSNGTGIPYPTIFSSVNNSLAGAGTVPVWFTSPCPGRWDYPCTVLGVAANGDFAEGVPFTLTNQYGQTKTYIPFRNSAGNFGIGPPMGNSGGFNYPCTLCVEYD